MELKNIKELMASMGKLGVKRLRLKQENFEIELEREDVFFEGDSFALSQGKRAPSHDHRGAIIRQTDIPPSLHLPIDQPDVAPKELPGSFVKSPMVGTFYALSGPDEPPFVKVGDTIDKDTVVCIVEAMKVMNEVKAGVAGVVAEVLIENSHPVEFGTKLFRIVEVQ